jgi:anti-sigma regulatory factor (Ser/Thr protein kinase)
MFNNVIDHSFSRRVYVRFSCDPYSISFVIRDFGIGVFRSITRQFHLQDEREAIGELLKGKTTTIAERHTGEGIFLHQKWPIGFRLGRTRFK